MAEDSCLAPTVCSSQSDTKEIPTNPNRLKTTSSLVITPSSNKAPTPSDCDTDDLQSELQRVRNALAEAEKHIHVIESMSTSGGAQSAATTVLDADAPATPNAASHPALCSSLTGTGEFFDRLRESNLLNPEEFERAMEVADDFEATACRLVEAGILTEWQAAHLVGGRTEFFLGNYKLIRLLHRGRMGGIFLGEHRAMSQLVAIKTLSKDVSRDKELFDRFLAAARKLGELEHPNIARALSLDNAGNRWYLVVEYVDGTDLEEIVKSSGPLEYAVAADYICQAAGGLHHAHTRNVLHHNIHPSHLMITGEGQVKAIGMGTVVPTDAYVTQRSNQVDYLAFEQTVDSAQSDHQVDHRADIYSLGCVLYFALTGQSPLVSESIRVFRPDAPKQLVGICEKMMARDPSDRYQSARVVAADIREFLDRQRH